MNAQYFLPICLGRANCCLAYLISPSQYVCVYADLSTRSIPAFLAV